MKSDIGAELLYLDQQLCFKLYTASRLMTRAYQPMLKALGITYPQYLVLMVLWELQDKAEQPCSLGTLGRRLQLDSGTLTPLLKRLQVNGLIERSRSAEDERQLQVQLTAQGERLREQACSWITDKLDGERTPVELIERLQADLSAFVDLFND